MLNNGFLESILYYRLMQIIVFNRRLNMMNNEVPKPLNCTPFIVGHQQSYLHLFTQTCGLNHQHPPNP